MSKSHGIAKAIIVLSFVALPMTSGCTKYYKVADPSTGKVYYSTNVDSSRSGAVRLRDGRTGDIVTIQNSEVQDISKEQYSANFMHSGKAPTPPAPEAASAKVAPAAAAGTAGAAMLASSPGKMRADLVAGKDQIDKTVNSLKELTDPNTIDLKAAYANYSKELDALNTHAVQTKAEADAMREAKAKYFAQWEGRIAEIENPTIREAAEARRARLRDAQEDIALASGEVKDAYEPFMRDLQDVRKFLADDLSKDTTAVLGNATSKAQKDGTVVKQKIDAVIAELDAVEGATAPKLDSDAVRN